ncbi:hypothetical protein KM043_017668 [Ampulex compressa]|nr:hypothetical protein KM043_017668 [Ampulex compressa]
MEKNSATRQWTKKILDEAGIRRRLATPQTPKQNGVAKHKNKTLVATARCMLTESDFSTSFWAEAIAAAKYVRKRCPTKILGATTSTWSSKRPDVSHLLLIALAVKYGLGISQLDVETAYLNGRINTDMYMEPPDSLREMLEMMVH